MTRSSAARFRKNNALALFGLAAACAVGGACSSGGAGPDADQTDDAAAGAGNDGDDGPDGAGGTGTGGEAGIPSVPNGPDGQALDLSRGALNVRYAEYLSKQDVVYQKPNANPLFGLTVGNGRVGAMVWNDGGLRMQVSGVDLSPQGEFAAGTVAFSTTPSLGAALDAATFEQRLVLHDGELTTHYAEGVDVTIFGQAGSEVLGLHVEDARTGVTSATLELSIWDVGGQPGSWKTVSTFADSTAAGLSRGQTEGNDFGYTLAATVEGAPFTTEQVDARTVRVTVTPTESYTIWLTPTARLNAPAHDSVAAARAALTAVKASGFEATHAAYQTFWHDFWSRSFVQYSGNADADYHENFYYLSTYVIAAGAYGDYPFHFINGVFRATEDETKWSNAYWYWNERDVYASFLASNHPEVMHGWNRMYFRNLETLLDFTEERYEHGGLWIPETMGWDGSASGTVGSDFTQDILSTATEAALHLYAEYLHTGDREFLEETVYPFIRETARFYREEFTLEGENYVMVSSNSHETYWDVENAITDLVSVRALFPIALALSNELGQDPDLRAGWQDLLDNVAPYPELDGTYAPHTPPVAQTRNNENVVCELIWPYAVSGIGSTDRDQLVQAWNDRPFPYGNVWAPDAIQAARLGLGSETAAGLKTMEQRYQTYPNGFTDNTNGVFEYWGVHLTALNESLLQSHGGRLRVFPALPPGDDLVTRFSLHAEGGFVVSSEREQSYVKYVGIFSERGEDVVLENPWAGEQAQVRRASDDAILVTAATAELSFETVADELYVVEPVDKPLSSYDYAHIDAAPQAGARSLGDGTATLGISRLTPEEMGRYEAEDSTLVTCVASNDSGASGGSEVTNLQQGSSLTFDDVIAGSGLDIRYCTDNDPGRLALYVNDVKATDVVFPTTNSWGGTYATLSVDVTIPAGASLSLRYEAGGSGANIDYLQLK